MIVTLDSFFRGHEAALPVFETLHDHMDRIGPAEMRISKSQISFRRRTAFAFAWVPDRYLRKSDVRLVLTVALRRRDDSPRWKQIVEPAPGHFIHHLELRESADIDDEVDMWLTEAWEESL